jgi:hypothetical protein
MLTTPALSVRKSNTGYVTQSIFNDMIGQKVQLYMSTEVTTGVFEGAQIVSGGGEGLVIRTSTNHPILLQTALNTVLTLGVGGASTFAGNVTVNGNITTGNGIVTTSSVTTSDQPFLHITPALYTIPTGGGLCVIPYSNIVASRGTVSNKIKCQLTTGGALVQGTFTFALLGLYQFEICYTLDGAFNGTATQVFLGLFKNDVQYVEKVFHRITGINDCSDSVVFSVLITSLSDDVDIRMSQYSGSNAIIFNNASNSNNFCTIRYCG